MKIEIKTNSRDFARNLYQSSEQEIANENEAILGSEPIRVSGSFESWYEMFLAIGVIGLPVGIIGNLIASKLWEVYKKSSGPEVWIKIRRTPKTDWIELKMSDASSLEDVVEGIKKILGD